MLPRLHVSADVLYVSLYTRAANERWGNDKFFPVYFVMVPGSHKRSDNINGNSDRAKARKKNRVGVNGTAPQSTPLELSFEQLVTLGGPLQLWNAVPSALLRKASLFHIKHFILLPGTVFNRFIIFSG